MVSSRFLRPLLIASVASGLPACSLRARTLDLDGDGYTASDCDDTRASVHPGADEVCDGADNDCNGLVDEGGACASMTTDSARVQITAEGSLGPTLTVGQLDGDGFGDVLVEATLGSSPGVCLVPGARLVDSVAGGLGSTAAMADAGTCWAADQRILGLAVTSAAPFGVTSSDVAWVLSVGDGLCAVNPFGTGDTVAGEAFGCTSLSAWTSLPDAPTGGVQSFGTADASTAALMARTATGLGIARPTGPANDPGTFWALATTTPLVGAIGGDDVDGDGIADIVAADSTDVWVVSSDLGITAPLLLAASQHLPMAAGETGVFLPGDIDGDGVKDWAVNDPNRLAIFANGQQIATLGPVQTATSAGDFNGDGRDDLAVRYTFASVAGILLGPMNGAVDDIRISSGLSTFAEGLGAIDVDRDGLTDLWLIDPGSGSGRDTGGDSGGGSSNGILYLLDGFPITAVGGRSDTGVLSN